MKKLLDSDWPKTVPKSVTLVQITHRILDYDLQEDNEKFCRPMISCKAMTNILYRNAEKSFLECERSGFTE